MEKKYPNKQFRKLVQLLNEEREDKSKKDRIYEAREIRSISWKAYNLSQINSIKETLTFIEKEVDRCDYPPRKVGKPLTDPKILAKIVLICEKFGLTERDAQGFLMVFGSSVDVKEIDDRVIGNAYDKFEVAYILQQIFDRTKDSDGKLGGDGTGLETSRKQNYGENRESTKEFLTSILDSREIIQAFDFSGEDGCKAMFELIEEVEGDSLRLDAGFNCRKLVRKIAELGMLPYVYPLKSNNINGDQPWREMYLEFFTDVILWLREYYLRVHTESFHSAFKRVFGIITKIKPHSKFVQVIARIILHNRARLSYFKRIMG